ncbi:MAG: DUF362 domain-containing protein [Dehalococcoidia bacterium]|nr:DUF362 domain-containing protein [Dehalococcoidia bacterium]
MAENQTKCRVFLERTDSDVDAALLRGLQYINWDRFLNSKSTVFIKPNFTFPRHIEGVTTSPELLRSLLRLLKGKAGRVILGESDGANHAFTAEESLAGHGMYDICREEGAEAISLSKMPSTTIESSVLGKKVTVQLPDLLLNDVDCFISAPVFKVHAMTTVTLSLKNTWGCVPDTMRCLLHQDLSHKLALIAGRLKPRIVIIDGLYSLDRHGPMYGEAVRTDLLLVSDNTVAADALGAMMMGFTPGRISHLVVAGKAGLGPLALADIEVNTDWSRYRRQFQIERTLIDRASGLLFHSGLLAKIVMDSALTPLIYKIVGLLRSSDEKRVAGQLGGRRYAGPY